MTPRNLPRAVWKNVLGFAVSLAFAAVGALMLEDGEIMGWAPMGFFALCAVVFGVYLIGDYGVSLDSEGFELRTVLSRKRWPWRDVSAFEIAASHRTRMIFFDDTGSQQTFLGKVNKWLFGRTSSLPSIVIGGKLEEACALLNAYRAQALSR
jgi:hypothetical protein